MSYPKKYFAFLLSLLPSFFIFTGNKAIALPFNENCASMEKYAQAIFTVSNSKSRVTFSDFSHRELENPFDTLLVCNHGYITISSPTGTKVCFGVIAYEKPTISYTVSNCRWK